MPRGCAAGLVAILPAIPGDKAKAIYEKGQDAERGSILKRLYNFYKQAYDLKPKDLRYKSSFERLRFKAGGRLSIKGKNFARMASCRRRWPTFKRRH